MSKIEEALKKAAQARQLQRIDSMLTDPESVKVTPPSKKPLEKSLLLRNRLVTLTAPQSIEAEQYKKLRTQILQRTKPNFQNTLMITSAIAGEGKTLTAFNLAIAIAQGVHETVLLVDCDFRRPCIHKLLDIEPKYGLSDYLTKNIDLSKLLVKTEINKLTILPAGQMPLNPSELLASEKMKSLVKEIKHRYQDRYILFDSAPLLPTTDPSILARQVDGVILVVQAGRTPRADVTSALKLLEGVNVLGVVLNSLDVISPNYYYYYDY